MPQLVPQLFFTSQKSCNDVVIFTRLTPAHLCHAVIHLLSAVAHRQDTVVQPGAGDGGMCTSAGQYSGWSTVGGR